MYYLDIAGTFVFAISGVLVARNHNIDVFGAAILGFVTAIGGGTLRDIMIGSTPVGWMLNLHYLIAIGVGISAAIFLKRYIARLTRTMFLFDAIGIGIFTVLGLEKTLDFGLSPIIAIMMGTVSAVFGGVLRDVLVDRIPLIFRSEIYATACFLGASLYFIFEFFGLPSYIIVPACILSIIIMRIVAVRYNLGLPVLYDD
ncbi:MAG: trimeric intracellular cation channel family protein [Bacteroidetes bacterium]|nr:trimeric intracellular cation channel family protein [Bacteroidota bacterium]